VKQNMYRNREISTNVANLSRDSRR